MDEQEPGGAPDPLRAAMQPMAEISRRVAEAIRSATLNTPRELPGTDLLLRYAETVSAVPRLAELMSTWAEQHRQMAEQLAESAELLRRLSQEGAALVDPILTYAERVSDVTDSWIDLFRPDPD